MYSSMDALFSAFFKLRIDFLISFKSRRGTESIIFPSKGFITFFDFFDVIQFPHTRFSFKLLPFGINYFFNFIVYNFRNLIFKF